MGKGSIGKPRPARIPRKTSEALRCLLAIVYADSSILSRLDFLEKLQKNSFKKKRSVEEVLRIKEIFFKKGWIAESEKSFRLEVAGEKAISRYRKYETPKEIFVFDQKRTVNNKEDKPPQKRERNVVVQNKSYEIVLRRLFEHDISDSFSLESFCRWVFDLLCAEWHAIKSCKNSSSKKPTLKSSRGDVKKMAKSGLINFEEADGFFYVYLTNVGALYCGLLEKEENQIQRKSKKEKFDEILEKLSDASVKNSFHCGLRIAKKRISSCISL